MTEVIGKRIANRHSVLRFHPMSNRKLSVVSAFCADQNRSRAAGQSRGSVFREAGKDPLVFGYANV